MTPSADFGVLVSSACGRLLAPVGAVLALLSGSLPDEAAAKPPGRAEAATDSAPAAPPPDLQDDVVTLEHVLRSALEHHPAVSLANYKVQSAEAKRRGAEGAFDTKLATKGKWQPQGKVAYGLADVGIVQDTPWWGLSARGGWRLGAGDVPVYFGDDDTAPGGEFYVGLSVPVLQGGETDRARTDIALAGLQVETAEQGRLLTAIDLRRAASAAYWEWLAACQTLAVDEALLALAEQRAGQLQRSVARGAVPDLELVDNSRAVLSRQGGVLKSAQRVAEAAQALSIFLRNEAGEPVVLDRRQAPGTMPAALPPAVDGAEQIELGLARRPDLQSLELAVRQSELESGWAENQQLPSLDLLLDVAQGVRPPALTTAKDTEVIVGLSLSVPLQRRKAVSLREAAMLEAASGRAKTRLAADKIRADGRKLLAKWEAAYQTSTLALQEWQVAQRVAAAEARKLELGASTALYVTIREEKAAEAAKKWIEATISIHSTAADFAAVVAAPFETPATVDEGANP